MSDFGKESIFKVVEKDCNLYESQVWDTVVEELRKQISAKEQEIEDKFREGGWYHMRNYYKMDMGEVKEGDNGEVLLIVNWKFNKEKFNKDFQAFLDELDKD